MHWRKQSGILLTMCCLLVGLACILTKSVQYHLMLNHGNWQKWESLVGF